MGFPRIASIIFQISFLSSSAYALEANFGKEIPTEAQISEFLKSSDDDAGKPRGLNMIMEKNDKRHFKHKPITPAANEKAISQEILFEFNSAALSETGKAQLHPVGSVLAQDDFKGMHYRIEGYTDIIGSDRFNFELSRRRAETVKEFLVSEYGLSSATLKTEGKGEKDLADAKDPTSEVNRRVRIVQLR